MARFSGNSLLNTLRGKIWISTSVLAFFICTFGLISYLVVTLLTNNPFYGVFIPFLFLAFTVIVFGWWLSNELVSPIENVILLAKSLERNYSSSLPKTSGSTETDQLLQTLHRNSQQMQNVVTLMDKVANGNIDIALTPLQGSDRLTASFQKLLTKVSESIHAKEDLDKLTSEIELVKTEISSVRNGNLNVEIQSEYFHTKEITDTIKYLLEKLTLLISIVKVDAHQAKDSAQNVERTIEDLIGEEEKKIQQMNKASFTLKQVPNLIEKITDDITRSAKSAKQTIAKTQHGTKISNQNSESVAKLRSNLRESINRIQTLNERSHEIAKVAKIVDDLANRTNMIALNASIQATELGEDGQSFVLVSKELERLANRANGTNKQISMLNSTILTEIGRVEESLDSTMGEVANLSKYTIETVNVLGELERYIGQFLNLQENLITFSNEQSDETDEAFETFVTSIAESENSIENLASSSATIKTIATLMKNLQSHTAEFRVQSQPDPQKLLFENSSIRNDEIVNPDVDQNSDSKITNDEFSTDEFDKLKLSTQEVKDMTMDSEESILEDQNSEGGIREDFVSAKTIEDNLNSSEVQDSNDQNIDSIDLINKAFASEEFDSGEFSRDDFDRESESFEMFGTQNSEVSSDNVSPEIQIKKEDLLNLGND